MNRAKAALRNAQVVQRASAGEGVAALAEEYDLTKTYLYLLIRQSGVNMPDRQKGRPPKGSNRVARRRAVLRELHSLGISGGAAFRLLNISRPAFYTEVRKCGLKFPYDRTGKLTPLIEATKAKAAKMARMYRAGMTLQQIGDKYGITRERVRQLMTKHEGMDQRGGGRHLKAVAKQQRAQATKDARYLSKYGCTFAQYAEVREIGREMRRNGAGPYQTPLQAFVNQRNNAKARLIPWELKFWQWWTIWQESGKWEQRGRNRDAFVMSRFADTGGYAMGNVYIGTASENCSIQPNNPYRKDHPDHAKVQQKNSRVKRGCAIEGCDKPHYAHSYCNNHYYHFVTKPAREPGERAAA